MQNNIESSGSKFTPINEHSSRILDRKEFALIGVSPFNSYFTAERITIILQQVIKNFDDFAIFIPDRISEYTLRAVGYDEQRIAYKLRKQDNYLKNKVIKALNSCNSIYQNKIITFSDLLKNSSYNQLYNLCAERFLEDQEFREGCLKTSSWVLSSFSEKKDVSLTDQNINIAVEYFIKELPIFLDVPKILNVNSCAFVYHSMPKFLEEIYHHYNLVSQNQGFVLLN